MRGSNEQQMRGVIRPCLPVDRPSILRIVNAAAEAYRGVIPADRWHNPYMSDAELAGEISAGVVFSGFEGADGLVGVMGIQHRGNVALIRHAYVLPKIQGGGIGSALLASLIRNGPPLLVGTWRAADWAIRFYRRNGFQCVPDEATGPLLRTYWTVPERQIETSTVLSRPAMDSVDAAALIAGSGFAAR